MMEIDMNIWTILWAMTYIVPVFWLLNDFDLMVEGLEEKPWCGHKLAWWLAVASVLFWPVAMIIEMMMLEDGE